MKYKQLIAVGERIRSTRMQLRYSRKAFEDKYGISAATLQAWEDGKYDVPLKGIYRYIEAINKAGLVTTTEWLIHGTGLPPRPASFNVLNSTDYKDFSGQSGLLEDDIILREVTYFESINKNPMVILISDDTMLPVFDVGDYVGGNKVLGKYAEKYIGTFCIVTLITGDTFVRKLKHGSKVGLFNLVSINTDSNLESAFILDCKISEISQIVWHRKSEKTCG